MLPSVGEQLKQCRAARGLTLEQVSLATHVRKFYLEALEADERDALPSRVQGRGFLRLYADYLNLPIEPLLAQWDGTPLPTPPAAPPPPSTTPEPAETTSPTTTSLSSSPTPAPTVEEQPQAEDELPYEPLSAPVKQRGAQGIFDEIGLTLRKQRESLGLSMIEVERYTHLRPQYLKALESGRLDDLPSPVQGRGMLSNYAAFLNLDSEAVLLRFAEGLQARRLERLPAPKEPGLFGKKSDAPKGAKPVHPVRRLITPDLIIGAGLIVAFFLFIIWGAARINTLRPAQSQATLPSVGEMLLISATATQATPGTAQPTVGTQAAAVPVAATPLPLSPATTPVPGSPEDNPSAPTSTLALINNDPLQLYVVARARAFLRITVDGQVKFNGRIVPGNAYPFSGSQRIELITGSAAALQIFFNQADLGVQGVTGQPLSLVFSAQGMLTATPASPPTPTATLPATPTLAPSSTSVTPTVTPLIP